MAKFALISALALFVALSAAVPRRKLSVKIPKECKNSQFCTIRPEGYDKIERMINSLLLPDMIDNMEHRNGPTIIERPETVADNCPSIKRTESYYFVRNKNDTNVDIIVQTSRLRQSLEVVKCETGKIRGGKDQQCFQSLGLNSFNMKFNCEETIATRSLLVYDPVVNKLKEKSYPISVCCSCKITSKY
ncbi:unnamed protein product [Chrysodeixis includens]|uniref:Spaetzle domain-containing protein n=1 Tax=Chrysodeixis includens TaxID=689277 RepID=A0A9P0C4H4_CHRIL|nr:unnamed protein product [Chrysodeixis includens]